MLSTEERRAEAWELRMAGYAEKDIAKALGVTQPAVSQYLRDMASMRREHYAALADATIVFEMDRINQMVIAWYARAKIDPTASDTLRKWLERGDRIQGLNIDRREISGPGGAAIHVRTSELDLSKLSDQELEWLQIIVAKAGPPAKAEDLPVLPMMSTEPLQE